MKTNIYPSYKEHNTTQWTENISKNTKVLKVSLYWEISNKAKISI